MMVGKMAVLRVSRKVVVMEKKLDVMLAVMKGTRMADKMVVDLAARMVGKMEFLKPVKKVDL